MFFSSSEEGSHTRNNIQAVLNSTELSGAMARETITISSVASPDPRIMTMDSDANEPTLPYGFGSQHPIVPSSLNDLNLPPKPSMCWLLWPWFKRMKHTAPDHRSHPTRPMKVSTIEGWETTYTTSDDATFYTDDEPSRVYRDISSSDTFDSTPPTPRRQKKKLSVGMSFHKQGGRSVAAHLRGMRPTLISQKDTLILRRNLNIIYIFTRL